MNPLVTAVCLFALGTDAEPEAKPMTVRIVVARVNPDGGEEKLREAFGGDWADNEDLQECLVGTMKTAKVVRELRKDGVLASLSVPTLRMQPGRPGTVEVGQRQAFTTHIDEVRAEGQVVMKPTNEFYETGLKFTVTPRPNAEHGFVTVRLKGELTTSAPATKKLFPITTKVTPVYEGGSQGEPIEFTQYLQQPTVKTVGVEVARHIPEGKSLILTGWEHNTVHAVSVRVPVLSSSGRRG